MKALADKIQFINRRKIGDSRGWFLKVIDGKEENIPNRTGEVYLTMALPGETKGSHYHNLANEWFTVIQGACEVRLEDISTGEKMTFELTENNPQTLFVPSKVAHAFVNTFDQNFILLAYSDELYDPVDTIPFQL